MVDKKNYNMAIKVKQSTIDDIKKIGMKAALERANKGDAGEEFTEAARRFYGKRVNPAKKPVEMAPKGVGHVYGEAAAPKKPGGTVSNKYVASRKSMA